MIKLTILFLCALICVHVFLLCDALPPKPKPRDFQRWHNFKARHSKLYKTVVDEIRRFNIFLENQIKIAEHNKRYKKGKESYELGTTVFSDLTEEEFSRIYLTHPTNHTRSTRKGFGSTPHVFPESIPDSKNWTAEGKVTPVKDQGPCGSCWAFSTAGAIEAHVAIASKKVKILSEQNLIDCVGERDWVDNSCEGGLMEYGYQYVMENKGIATKSSYPYQAEQGECQYKPDFKGATIKGYESVEPDEEIMKKVVGTIGPVSVAIYNANLLQHYTSGTFSNPKCGSTMRAGHALLIVGYGTDETGDYWLLKNSWSASWGMNGYFKLARNKDMCKISGYVHFPTGAKVA
ncbi:procathepsin L-like [Planococcus citri]|uniref:procathepsin L-like n=1 Tax=Planococcus citri TaxID=170843 RepID=UPI0031FA1836